MSAFKFKVIEGGLADKSEDTEKNMDNMNDPDESFFTDGTDVEFESGWITDTRLMGVVSMYICWRFDKRSPHRKLHQFFYFDVAEYGFDRFEYLIDATHGKVEDVKNTFIGGLGGNTVPVSEPEAIHLVHEYAKYNRRANIPLPNGSELFQFMLDWPDLLTDKAQRALFHKSCTPIKNPRMAANYFLMRLCDKDRQGAAYLSEETADKTIFAYFPALTLYKNEIEETEDNSLLCKTVVGYGERSDYRYLLMISTLKTVSHTKDHCEQNSVPGFTVSKVTVESAMRLSDREAYMNLVHEEYVSVFHYSGSPDDFGRHSTELTKRAMIIEEATGRLFMIYNNNNDHVDSDCYHLYDDLLGTYFLLETGQLISTANTKANKLRLDYDLLLSGPVDKIRIQNSFLFNEPVLNAFIQSGYEDFYLFLNDIQRD